MPDARAPARITGLEPDPHRPGALRLLVNGRPYCAIPAASELARRLGVGQPLEPPLRAEIEQAADAEAAYRALLRALGRRSHARADLARRLVRRGHPSEAVEQALQRAASAGLIDDARFALDFVETRAARGRGPARLRRDLLAAGVDSAVIDRALVEAWPPDVDPKTRALQLAQKRAAQLGRLPSEVKRRRVLGYLARRGFAGPEVRAAVAQLLG